jgi:hypothetical protein
MHSATVEARSPAWWRPLVVPLLVLAVWAALFIALDSLATARHVSYRTCLLHNLAGVPCPTCGGTRAAKALLAGDPLQAVAWNPLLVIGGAAAALWLVACFVNGRLLTIRLSGWRRPVAWLVAAALLAANWAYVIARGN